MRMVGNLPVACQQEWPGSCKPERPLVARRCCIAGLLWNDKKSLAVVMNRTQRPTETFYFSFFFFPAVNACFFFRGSLPKKTTKQKRSKRRRLRNFRSSGVRGCESSQPNGEKTGLNSWRVQPKTQINNFAATLSTAHWRMYRMRKGRLILHIGKWCAHRKSAIQSRDYFELLITVMLKLKKR